mmetsp:Transcript_12621/g.30714  ORF Transcript_12621/g.30714 Transcript_12621/m.30714 type:complete len:515 (-) Transcript_12621:396-1940(-)
MRGLTDLQSRLDDTIANFCAASPGSVPLAGASGRWPSGGGNITPYYNSPRARASRSVTPRAGVSVTETLLGRVRGDPTDPSMVMPTPTGLIVPNAGMPSYVWGSEHTCGGSQQQKELYGEVVGGGAQQMEYQYLRVVEDESRDSAAGSALYSAGAADALEAPDQMNDDALVLIPAASTSSTSAMPPPRIVKGKGKGKATKSKTQEVRGSGNGVVFRPSSTTSSVVQPAKNEEEISPVLVVGISPNPSSACAAPAAESMSTPASNAEMTAQFQQQRAPSAEDFSTPKDDQHELSPDKLTPSRTSICTTAPRTLFGTTSLFANSTPAVTATTPAGSIFGPPAGGAPAVASTTPSPPKPATQQPQDAETTSLVSGFQSLFSPSRPSVTSLGVMANIDISPAASGGAGAGLFGGGGAATSTQSQPGAIPVGEAVQPGQGQGGVGFGASSPSPAVSPTRLFLSFANVASGMSIGPGGGPADQIPLPGDAVSDTSRPDVNMDFGEVPPDIDMEEADHDML